MAELFEAWKAEQRTTPRLSKAQEDPLWKRFREARSTFERRRKAFFVKRDKDAAEIKKAKDEIIAEAEKLSASRDFGPTTKAYHRLMDQWKALGRGPAKRRMPNGSDSGPLRMSSSPPETRPTLRRMLNSPRTSG